jgi:hypothetical protein
MAEGVREDGRAKEEIENRSLLNKCSLARRKGGDRLGLQS